MKEPTAEWVYSQLYRELVLEKGVQGNSKLASLSSLLSVLLCEGRSLAFFFFKEISLDRSYVRVKRTERCMSVRELFASGSQDKLREFKIQNLKRFKRLETFIAM